MQDSSLDSPFLHRDGEPIVKQIRQDSAILRKASKVLHMCILGKATGLKFAVSNNMILQASLPQATGEALEGTQVTYCLATPDRLLPGIELARKVW